MFSKYNFIGVSPSDENVQRVNSLLFMRFLFEIHYQLIWFNDRFITKNLRDFSVLYHKAYISEQVKNWINDKQQSIFIHISLFEWRVEWIEQINWSECIHF